MTKQGIDVLFYRDDTAGLVPILFGALMARLYLASECYSKLLAMFEGDCFGALLGINVF